MRLNFYWSRISFFMEITLFKPNELVSAIDQIQVNRTAKHLCNYFLQYAQQQLKFHNHKSNKFELNISKLNEEAQIGLKDYKLIEKSLDALMHPVTIRPRDNPKNFIKLAPIYLIAVDTDAGMYRYSLAPEVIEILRTTDYFTKLNLHDFNFLESKYSIVLYEWLKRYESAPQIPVLTVEELRKITNTAEKKTYDNFSDFQKRVLDVAVSEISEKTPYTVTYETIKTKAKTRPKVSAVQFSFAKKTGKKSIAGFSGVVTDEIQQVHDKYLTLVNKYVTSKRATSDEVYRATYVADYGCLEWWYEHKTLPLSVLISDIKSGKRQGRWKSQLNKYLTLVSCLDLASQEAINNGKSRQGFCEQVLKMQIALADTPPVDQDKWI